MLHQNMCRKQVKNPYLDLNRQFCIKQLFFHKKSSIAGINVQFNINVQFLM